MMTIHEGKDFHRPTHDNSGIFIDLYQEAELWHWQLSYPIETSPNQDTYDATLKHAMARLESVVAWEREVQAMKLERSYKRYFNALDKWYEHCKHYVDICVQADLHGLIEHNALDLAWARKFTAWQVLNRKRNLTS